jgi:hypothetical protein
MSAVRLGVLSWNQYTTGPYSGRVGMRATAIVAALLLAAWLSGCGIKEDYRTPFVIIHNRTLTTVAFDGGWVPRCDRTSFGRLPPWPSPRISPPPGTPHINFDLGVPPTYVGEVTVIITETGVEVVRGFVADGSLPQCAGAVPSPS